MAGDGNIAEAGGARLTRREALRRAGIATLGAGLLPVLQACGAPEEEEPVDIARVEVEGAPDPLVAVPEEVEDEEEAAAEIAEAAVEDDVAEEDAEPAAGGEEHVVEMTDQLVFVPDDLTINVGDTVTWTTVGAIPHTSTADPAQAMSPDYVRLPDGAEPWDSGMVNSGDSWSHTFEVPGEYVYFCTPHQAAQMIASVTVVEA